MVTPVEGEPLQLSGHSGIVRYEPTELVLSARAGTPIPEIEAALAENGQMLTFEPPDFDHTASLGGAIASGLGGPRRPWGGAPRDQLLGITLLDGRGRILHFGGEVMKNVAGYDLSRLMAGALGTLGVLLEVSIKVLPAPTAERSLVLELSRERALEKMRELARQPAPLSAACHLDDRLHLRLSGNSASVAAWEKQIGGEAGDGDDFWRRLRNHRLRFSDPSVRSGDFRYRRPLPASDCEHQVLTDWAGAQRWVYSQQQRDGNPRRGRKSRRTCHTFSPWRRKNPSLSPPRHRARTPAPRTQKDLRPERDSQSRPPVRFDIAASRLLCGALFLPQTANAFFCLLMGSGNKNYARSVPYPVNRYARPMYHRLPPIMPNRHVARQQSTLPRPRHQKLRWRPVDYRSGSL